MTRRFRLGDQVVALRPDAYLRRNHDVVPGETVGTVTEDSHLAADDEGLLVDWGTGGAVRCEPGELARAEEHLFQIVSHLETNAASLIPNYGPSPWHEFDDTFATDRPRVRWVPRCGSQHYLMLAAAALDRGYTVVSMDMTFPENRPAYADAAAELMLAMVQAGNKDMQVAIGQHTAIRIEGVTIARDGIKAHFFGMGEYISRGAEAFHEVFVPFWATMYPPKRVIARKRGWRRFLGR